MKAVKKQARLQTRRRCYYHQKIPSDLNARYGRRREIKVSLKTDSVREARNLALGKSLEWNREFDHLRSTGLGKIPMEDFASLPWEHQVFINARKSGRVLEVRTIDEDFMTKVCRTFVRVGLSVVLPMSDVEKFISKVRSTPSIDTQSSGSEGST